jgi:Uma2 family endonuclease
VIEWRAEPMALSEIVLPTTEPETEWVRGRALQKMSPQRDHARLQTALAAALFPWAKGRGEIGTEWRFRVAPPGAPIRPLIPDISFVRNERLRGLSHEELQIPLLAPDVAFEILSLGDRRDDVDHKISVLLRSGSMLVVVVDPEPRLVELHDVSGTAILGGGGVLEHPALPGFRYPLAELFAELDLPR